MNDDLLSKSNIALLPNIALHSVLSPDIDLPYARLNLRFNPFGQQERQAVIETAVPRCDLDSVDAHLNQDRTAVQFTGQCGRGKSTHLMLLASRHPDFRYIYLPEGTRQDVPLSECLMIDEAQRLRRRQRQQLFRFSRQVILGTHQCLRRVLHSHGFRVITVSLDRQITADWLTTALNRRIETARRSPADLPLIDRAMAVNLLAEFGNNIRGIERKLYEIFYTMNHEAQ